MRLRARLADLSDQLRYEEAARLRDRLAALERFAGRARRPAASACLPAGSRRAGSRAWASVTVLASGRVADERPLAAGAGARLVAAALAAAARAEPSLDPADAADLRAVAPFLRWPPPELRVVPLERDAILGAHTSLVGVTAAGRAA